jgi:uncharacterized protein
MAEKKKACAEHLEGKASKIVIDKECIDPNMKNPPTFILGFTGTGMIGTITVNEIIEQLEMAQVGHVLSEDLPPITLFYNGLLRHPFRIYHSDTYNLIVSICEVPFLPGRYADLARTLMSWALAIGITDVICVQGMADNSMLFRDEPSEVYGAGVQEILDRFKDYDIKKPPKGLIMGPEAAILNECLNNGMNPMILLVPANPQIPAPEGAATILEKLSKMYKFPVKLDNLSTQAIEIKKNLMELMDKTNKMHSQELGTGTGSFDESRFYS